MEEKSKSCDFLDASTLLYMRVCQSICPSNGPSVHWSNQPSVRPFVCPSIHPTFHLSVCPSYPLSVHPSILTRGGRGGGNDRGGVHLMSGMIKLEQLLFFSSASLYLRVCPSISLFVYWPVHHALFRLPYSSN